MQIRTYKLEISAVQTLELPPNHTFLGVRAGDGGTVTVSALVEPAPNRAIKIWMYRDGRDIQEPVGTFIGSFAHNGSAYHTGIVFYVFWKAT